VERDWSARATLGEIARRRRCLDARAGSV
jgi:hypothetical protein